MTRLIKLFGDLKVRPKLMTLHNLFFLILAAAVYFSLIPLFEKQVANARARELSIITQIFSADLPLSSFTGMEIYDYRESDAATLHLEPKARIWMDAHPGAIWNETNGWLLRKDPKSGLYRTLRIPRSFYSDAVERATLTFFIVLGVIYALAVLLLESAMMPLYVYRPLRLMLHADAATQCGDRQHEMIDPALIFGDEIGQIMTSRNATVAELRKRESDLAAALQRLEETAADLKYKNELLETAKKNLEEQDRLASLGLLSASVAHELNTPLAVLQGSIEKMMETTESRPALDRLARMERVTLRLRRISESLLDFARARKQVMELRAIHPLIEEAWGLVAIDEKASVVNFRNQVNPEITIMGNSDRLIQVFVNLLRNALNAVTPSGIVTVSARPIERNDRQWVSVTIDDDGPGIPPDVLPEIFEAFVTTRLDSRGTGLGLTVAEGIISQHGGTISACNRPQGGACLEVRLPAGGKGL